MLNDDNFFDFKAKAEEEAGLRKIALETLLTLEGLVRNPVQEAATLLGSGTGQFLSRDGTTVTMIATENTIVDLVQSTAAHSMKGGGGYIETVTQLSSIFDTGSSRFGQLQAWENSSGGWHFLKPEHALTTLDLTVAFLSGFGFTLLNYLADPFRLAVGAHNAFVNVSTTIVENVVNGVKKGVNNIGNFITGTIETLNSTFDRALDYVEIKFKDAFFGNDNVKVLEGSAIIQLDLDLNSLLEAQTHLLGSYDLSRFFIVPGSDGTKVVYSKYAQLQASELADILIGTDVDEVVAAFSGNDHILALGGADQINGGPGNDTLDGGTGIDTAVFQGNHTAYRLAKLNDGTLRISGPDGVDTLSRIERFQFDDGTFAVPATQFDWLTFGIAQFGNDQGWTSFSQNPRQVADVNGDGMDDIVGFGSGGTYVALATGGGNFGPLTYRLGQFGNDQGWSSFNQNPRQLADVNGDGMADIVGFGSGGTYVALATGGGNFGPLTYRLGQFGSASEGGGWSSIDHNPRKLADVNGDDMADIVGFGNGGTYVALATGGGQFGPLTYRLGQFGE